MTVESATYLNGLDATYPVTGDQIAEGDDHVRLMKTVLKNTFPGRAAQDNRTSARSAGYTPTNTEVSVVFVHTATLTVTLPVLSGMQDGTVYGFICKAGTTTIARGGTDTINGAAASVTLSAVQGAFAWKNGTDWALIPFRGKTAVPVSEGGTGATTAAAARAALGVEAAEVSVATATGATTDIGAAASLNILLTTTATTITGFATATAGVTRNVRVSTGGITLTHSATFILPGAANIVAKAGDCFEAYSFGSGWIVRNYQKASGAAVVAPTISYPVSSVFGRTGAVTLQSSDITTALGFTPANNANAATDHSHSYAPMTAVVSISDYLVGSGPPYCIATRANGTTFTFKASPVY